MNTTEENLEHAGLFYDGRKVYKVPGKYSFFLGPTAGEKANGAVELTPALPKRHALVIPVVPNHRLDPIRSVDDGKVMGAVSVLTSLLHFELINELCGHMNGERRPLGFTEATELIAQVRTLKPAIDELIRRCNGDLVISRLYYNLSVHQAWNSLVDQAMACLSR